MRQQKTHPHLKRIIKNLKPYRPEKVILYGSWARGDITSESDLDLLVIKKTKKPYYDRLNEAYQYLCREEDFGTPRYPYGLDLKVYTPEEMERELELGNFFFEEILEQGKVLYEKA